MIGGLLVGRFAEREEEECRFVDDANGCVEGQFWLRSVSKSTEGQGSMIDFWE